MEDWNSSERTPFLEDCKDRALAGDVSAAKELLHDFCESASGKTDFHAIVIQYLASAFNAILTDASIDPAKALFLVGPRHRPKGSTARDSIAIAAQYYLLVMRDDMSKTDAKKAASERFHTVLRNVEYAINENDLLSNLPICLLEALAETSRN